MKTSKSFRRKLSNVLWILFILSAIVFAYFVCFTYQSVDNPGKLSVIGILAVIMSFTGLSYMLIDK
jgi:hypothetical protein